MSGKWMGRLALCALQCVALTGLCASVQANTTAAPELVRIAVLLPLRSPTLGAVAEAVRAGVYAAFQREPGGVTLQLIDTDGSVAELKEAYAKATVDADMIIGPLSRTEVGSVAQHAQVEKPTIALASPELDGGSDQPLPAKLLSMGLSIEDEARQVANWINATQPEGDALVVATSISWQRRAAKAFVAQWQALGRSAQTVELGWSDGFLNSIGVAELKQRLRADHPALLFVALDALQAGQLRNSVGREIAMVGTSQLNALARNGIAPADIDDPEHKSLQSLEGVRLVDIPWQLEADHPAVMVYPPLSASADQPLSAVTARLYALGIDAYRVAHALVEQGRRFALDGVTGQLRVGFETGGAQFERVLQAAVVRDGIVQPLRDGK